MWTAQRVRDELPDVDVKIGKKVLRARLSGRLNAFATVSVTNSGTPRRGWQLFMDWHFSWDTIARCLNSGKPLIG
jgi:hypothetical protein